MKISLCKRLAIASFALAFVATPAAHARVNTDGDATRGVAANETAGRYAEALAEYNAMIKRSPQDAAGYQARGRLNLILGKNGAAAADLRQAVRLKPNDPYNVLWLHFARNRESAPDAMELQANAARADRAAWPGPVLDYLTGKIDATAVLAKAGEGKAKAAQTCEAELFLGQDDVAAGRRAQGLDRLNAAVRDCDDAPREGKLARANLPGAAPEPVLTPAFAPKAKAPAADPIIKPAWVKPAPPAPLQTAAQTQVLAGDPLGLRGSLR